MASQTKQEAQNPLLLRCHRLIDAFAKSNEERDFFLDRMEGFLIYVDLDKTEEELVNLESELKQSPNRYCSIPKLSYYETKKIMEGFVNEKVYDIDTKEKLLDIIQSKEARENFLEFVNDHHAEFDKWQQYYQERSRIRIIEWLRNNHFHFVFEEDLDLPKVLLEKLKLHLFDAKVGKDLLAARKALITKAKTYYSMEALNPRPKRGRPPKQAIKQEIEPQFTSDIYTTVPISLRTFLFTPEVSTIAGFAFSSKFENASDLTAGRRNADGQDLNINMDSFNQKLASLRSLSSKWVDQDKPSKIQKESVLDFNEDDEDDDFEGSVLALKPKSPKKKKTTPVREKSAPKIAAKSEGPKKPAAKSEAAKRPAAKKVDPIKAPKKTAATAKKTMPAKTPQLRSIIKTKKK